MDIDKRRKNIISSDGRILFYSIDDFISEICNKEVCFICGADKTKKKFNDEHIIPKWILKRFGLFNHTISLPNNVEFKYSRYLLKCCSECNSFLGKNIEDIISSGLGDNYEKASIFFEENKKLIFIWLCLLITKTHLKDRSFKYDLRKDIKIGDMYEWEALHHIHCVARSLYTGCKLKESVIGTIILLPCHEYIQTESFDYMDRFYEGIVLVRLGPYFILAVLNDLGIVYKLLKPRLDRITGSLQLIQIREIFARACEANLRILNRPRFLTYKLKNDNSLYCGAVITEDIKLSPPSEDTLGKYMVDLISDMLVSPDDPIYGTEIKIQIDAMKKGQWTYLFDCKGDFIDGNIKFKDERDTPSEI